MVLVICWRMFSDKASSSPPRKRDTLVFDTPASRATWAMVTGRAGSPERVFLLPRTESKLVLHYLLTCIFLFWNRFQR